MYALKVACLVIAAFMFSALAGRSNAQSIGYADAIGQVGMSCSRDIDKSCKKLNLGGGRISQCLEQNQTVSPACKATVTSLKVLLTTRAQARSR